MDKSINSENFLYIDKEKTALYGKSKKLHPNIVAGAISLADTVVNTLKMQLL
jgi:hypothetical protein